MQNCLEYSTNRICLYIVTGDLFYWISLRGLLHARKIQKQVPHTGSRIFEQFQSWTEIWKLPEDFLELKGEEAGVYVSWWQQQYYQHLRFCLSDSFLHHGSLSTGRFHFYCGKIVFPTHYATGLLGKHT